MNGLLKISPLWIMDKKVMSEADGTWHHFIWKSLIMVTVESDIHVPYIQKAQG